MTLTLHPATDTDRPVIENLSSYYIYDMSEFAGWPCSEGGLYGGCDEFFADWRAGLNDPFLMRVDGELAGFCGVKLHADGVTHEIAEFFLLRKFRHRGLAQQIARELFARFPGPWHIEALVVNTPAVRFWGAVTKDLPEISTHVADSPWGPRQVYRFCWNS